MRRASQLPKNGPDTSLVTTTRNMADAVSFLIRVAADVGLGAIASKLTRVRVNLLTLASETERDIPANSPGEPNPLRRTPKGDSDAKRKFR
jgi:hypothetical protein